MPRGYRCIVFAIIGWLALCGAQLPAKQPNSSGGTEKAAPATQTTARPTPTTTPTPKFTAYPGYDPDPCYHAEDHDAADLCAQWRASIAAEKAAHEARRATTWSIIAAFLNVLSLALVAFALILTIQANRIAKRIGEAQTRAYLSIKSLSGKKTGRGLVFEVVVQNSGQSPALSTQVMLEVIYQDGKPVKILPDEEHFIPAQSKYTLAYCYFNEPDAINWDSTIIIARVAYADVFFGFHDLMERFAGIPANWNKKTFSKLMAGFHIASYLRAANMPEFDADEDRAANDDTRQRAEG